MASSNAKGQRIALVVNAKNEGDLTGGLQDATRMFSILTRPDLGACSAATSVPLMDCSRRSQFDEVLSRTLSRWNTLDQLVLYLTCHGDFRRTQYCLKLGPSESDYTPFNNVLNLLEASGVVRAIIILDACHSGAATGAKAVESVDKAYIPKDLPSGVLVLASSHQSQASYELPDGSASVFTHLLCEGIETGMGGNRPTPDGLICAPDIIDYVSHRLSEDEELKDCCQQPVYKETGAERRIWLAHNKSGSTMTGVSPEQPVVVYSQGDLEVLYKMTLPLEHPCAGASSDDLDWTLIERYARGVGASVEFSGNPDTALRELGLLAEIPVSGGLVPHKSAVLCFGKTPQLRLPSSASSFVCVPEAGRGIKTEVVDGPLSEQIIRLIESVRKELRKLQYPDASGQLREVFEISESVFRELISNAVAHRDYEHPGQVQVRVTPEALEIRSPGRFPTRTSWKDLIEKPNSVPVNRAVAHYLKRLLTFEGIGQGFEVFRKYVSDNGPDSLTYDLLPGNTTLVRVMRGSREYLELEQELPGRAVESDRVLGYTGTMRQDIKTAAVISDEQVSFITNDPNMLKLLEVIDSIAQSNASVLVTGESGTGKDLLCHSIHRKSQRHEGPLVELNCAAITDSLVEVELFGVAHGVATGVAARTGKFEVASGGTLILDEIGDLSLPIQSKLLHVLENQQFERVGSNKPVFVDIRFMYTTNRDLVQMIRDGTFREDLYYRINSIVIDIPPLRWRPLDVPVLLDHFSNQLRQDGIPIRFDPVAMRALVLYSWPGNVRELRNVVERLTILQPGKQIGVEHLWPVLQIDYHQGQWDHFESLEASRIRYALKDADWNQSKAAKYLSLPLSTLRRKIRKYGMKRSG